MRQRAEGADDVGSLTCENLVLRTALKNLGLKVSQLEAEREHLLSEKVFDFVNAVYGSPAQSVEPSIGCSFSPQESDFAAELTSRRDSLSGSSEHRRM